MALWDPCLTLNLQSGGESEWICAALSAEGSDDNTRRRCTRTLRAAEVNKIRCLLAEMAHQMPDQVEYNVLLHLGRAALCSDQPNPHQGHEEANVIYEWTRLMGIAAEQARAAAGPVYPPPASDEGEEADKSEAKPSSPSPSAAGPLSGPLPGPTRRPFTIAQRRALASPTVKSPVATTTITASSSSFGSSTSTATAPKVILIPPSTPFPPSPPDSAATPIPVLPPPLPLPLQHPAPLSLVAAAVHARLMLDARPLATGTTMDTERSRSSAATSPRQPPSASGQLLLFPASPTTIVTNDGSSLSSQDAAAAAAAAARPSLRRLPCSVKMAPPDSHHQQQQHPPPPPPPSQQHQQHQHQHQRLFSAPPDLRSLPRPLPSPPSLGLPLGELEEYNRLLQETQARHDMVLRQTARLRRELGALRREQGPSEAAAAAAATGVVATSPRPHPGRSSIAFALLATMRCAQSLRAGLGRGSLSGAVPRALCRLISGMAGVAARVLGMLERMLELVRALLPGRVALGARGGKSRPEKT